jgi:hypothetical protein
VTPWRAAWLILVALYLSAPVVALAAGGLPAGAIERGQEVAAQMWGSVCPADSDTVASEWATTGGTDWIAVEQHDEPYIGATPDLFTDCRIMWNPDYRDSWLADFAWVCTYYVHETGHLTGHEHSTDPSSVMYAQPQHPLPACADPTPTPVAPAQATARRPKMWHRNTAPRWRWLRRASWHW